MAREESEPNVLFYIDEAQRTLKERIAQRPESPQTPRKKKPQKRKPKSKRKLLRRPISNVQVGEADRVERVRVTAPMTTLVRNEGLWGSFPGAMAYIDGLRDGNIRTHFGGVFADKEVQRVIQSMEGYIQSGEAEEHRAQLAQTLFCALAFQWENTEKEGNAVLLRPSEVKGMLLDQPHVPDGLLLVSSQDRTSTDIIGAYQYIHTRQVVSLKKIDMLVALISATSSQFSSAYVTRYLHELYPDLTQRVTVGRQDFTLRYVLPADLEGPVGISEDDIDRVPLSGKDLGITVTRVGDLRTRSFHRTSPLDK